MKLKIAILPLTALALMTGTGAAAQVTNKTEVSHDTSMHDGVATHTTKVVQIHKRKTHRAKRILGVKVGHKTVTQKTIRETTQRSDGGHTTTVKHTH